jgi:hypothetical protein
MQHAFLRVAGDELAQRLGVQLFAERGRADQVGEDHRDRLAYLRLGDPPGGPDGLPDPVTSRSRRIVSRS